MATAATAAIRFFLVRGGDANGYHVRLIVEESMVWVLGISGGTHADLTS
jgi:hypothetical protein